MKQLPEKFSKGGFTFTFERRSEHAAIYRQQWNGKEDASVAYEVVQPQISARAFIEGRWQEGEPHEVYPSSETWGLSGWTFTNLDEALSRYALLPLRGNRRKRFPAKDESGERKRRSARISR